MMRRLLLPMVAKVPIGDAHREFVALAVARHEVGERAGHIDGDHDKVLGILAPSAIC